MENTETPIKKEATKNSSNSFINYLTIASSFTSIIAFIILIFEKTEGKFNLATLVGGFFTALWYIFVVLLGICIFRDLFYFRIFKNFKNLFVLALLVLFGGAILFGIMVGGYYIGDIIYFLGSSFIIQNQ